MKLLADADTTKSHRYDASISYSYKANSELANVLQVRLERWARPWFAARTAKLFRDQVSLAATPQLWTTITENLDNSGYLILLASPDSAKSNWVTEPVLKLLSPIRGKTPQELLDANDKEQRAAIALFRRLSFGLGIAAVLTVIMRTRRLLYERESENLEFKSNLATELERLGAGHFRLDEMEKAEQAYQESLELCRGLAEFDSNNHEYQYHYAIAQERLADIWREHAELTDVKVSEQVEKPYQMGLEIRKNLVLANPQNLLYRRAVDASERRLGQLLIEITGAIPEGVNHLQATLMLLTQPHHEIPTDVNYTRDAAVANVVMA